MEDGKKGIDFNRKVVSLLDEMQDKREYESLTKIKDANINIQDEIQRSFSEIQSVRQREVICYAGNVVNPNIKGSISIDNTDDLPFAEMVDSIPSGVNEIDIILVTGGGSANQVAKFVNKLRPRFQKVSFIIPNIAMSAGTLFTMSGNEIIMGQHSYLGPVDPQARTKDGMFVPAQSLLTLIEDIEVRNAEAVKNRVNPRWTDLQLLRNLDSYQVATAKTSSELIEKMVEEYLTLYKFDDWKSHTDGRPVTEEEKIAKAKSIAKMLCNHSTWKAHDKGISREVAWQLCQLHITAVESLSGLDRALRRFWALLYYTFENSDIRKLYASNRYYVTKSGASL